MPESFDSAPTAVVTSDQKESDVRRIRLLTLTSVTSTVIALLAVIATIVSASLAYHSTREAGLRAERVDAYTNYIEVRTRFHEFVWSHLYHAGTDTETNPGTDPEFWPDAIEITSSLESANVRARMMAQGTEVADILMTLREDEVDTFRKFKCMADLQCSGELIAPAANGDIEDMLTTWTSKAQKDIDLLIAATSKQLQ